MKQTVNAATPLSERELQDVLALSTDVMTLIGARYAEASARTVLMALAMVAVTQAKRAADPSGAADWFCDAVKSCPAAAFEFVPEKLQ